MEHDPTGRDAKRRALEEFYGGEVPESTVERVTVLDADDLVHPFVD
ncbi:hypothetical protein [Microbacterium hydrocarbonoxydans]